MRGMHLRALALVLGIVLMLGAPHSAHAAELSETPAVGWGVDGRVNAVLIVGDTVYVGGNFDRAVSPTGALVARQNLAAFSVSTGQLSSFRADANYSVRALATDGAGLYVAGQFGRIQGVPRARVARIDLATGAVDAGFRADVDSVVYALDVADGYLYVGGNFSTIGGIARTRLAKVSATTGSVDGTFQSTANGTVRDVIRHPTSGILYASGSFSALNGTSRAGVGAVSSTTGATLAPAFTGSVRPTLALDVSDDGSMLYGALGAGSNSATAWSTATGARVWRQTAMGDTQAVHYVDETVYFGFHEGFAGDTTVRVLAADARTGALVDGFRPAFDRFWGVFAIAASDAALLVGGDFTRVEGVSARNLARFLGEPGAEGGGSTQAIVMDGNAATWRYWDRGAPASGWHDVTFDDASWPQGRAEFGYGDGDETTVVSYGPSASSKYITTYLRVDFTVQALPEALAVHVLADDGAVIYLNGVEVARDNMPTGTITDTTRAATTRSGGAESVIRSFDVDPRHLVVGTNTLAVEVHQASPSSSDLSLDADVSATFQE